MIARLFAETLCYSDATVWILIELQWRILHALA